jgi:hypothetical protein
MQLHPPQAASNKIVRPTASLQVVELLPSRMRRRFSRGLTRKHTTLLKKLRKAVRLWHMIVKGCSLKLLSGTHACCRRRRPRHWTSLRR